MPPLGGRPEVGRIPRETDADNVSALVGCSPSTDDVYTPAESGPVGRIARGEASFPIAVGAQVPDVDGRATELTASMRGIRIELTGMRVDGSCDPTESGEFYFDFGMDHRVVARRSAEESQSTPVGNTVALHASRVFFAGRDQRFSVYAVVSENDDFLNFQDDDVGTVRNEHHPEDVAPHITWHDIQVGSGDCKVVMTYGLERVQ